MRTLPLPGLAALCLVLPVFVAAQPDRIVVEKKIDLVPPPPPMNGVEATTRAEDDETTLKDASLSTEAADLVAFFKGRIPREADADKVRGLIKNLGDDSFRVRQKASEELLTLGPGIASLLRESANNSDIEVAVRTRDCLRSVEKTSTPAILSAAARLLGNKKHADSVKTLLEFAPHAPDEGVIDALREGLVSAGLRDGKPDPALTAALEEKLPVRRALAIDALAKIKQLDDATARKFLKDPDGLVSLRAALVLVEREDKDAIPVLIAALPKVTLQQCWPAEDVLVRLAGEQAPNVSLGQDVESRKTASTAWDKWWKDNGEKVKLASLKDKPPILGFTSIVMQDFNGIGKMMELGKDNKPRWEIPNLGFPVDIQVVGNERVLIAEMNSSLVTERNRKGEVLWKQQVQQPIACQRLANGNTVVGHPNGVFEFDAKGKQVFNYTRNRWDVMGVRKHRNGEYILLTRNQVVRIDKDGKEVKAFNAGRIHNYTSFEVLPNGNLLVPLNGSNTVVEYNLEGATVWTAQVQFATSAQRLPNGNTLVSSYNTQRIVELDRTGKTVNTITVQGMPWAAVRR